MTAEIGDKVKHEPTSDEKDTADKLRQEDEKKYDELAQELEKLDVGKETPSSVVVDSSADTPSQTEQSEQKEKKATL